MMRAFLATLLLCAFAGGAEARRMQCRTMCAGPDCRVVCPAPKNLEPGVVRVARDSRPHAWCGWYLRHYVGADPGVAFNLARKWAQWGERALAPAEGVVVVWAHHVGIIVGRAADGQWLVHSGNDGHAVRTRPRSLAGVIALRRGG